MRAGVLALLVLTGGCATVRPPPPVPLVSVAAFTVAFPRPGAGQVEATLDLPPGVVSVRQVTWTLKVKGVVLATGVEGVPRLTPGTMGNQAVLLSAPLVLRHLNYSEGAAWVQVGLEGRVMVTRAGDEVELAFSDRREVLVDGVPGAMPRD